MPWELTLTVIYMTIFMPVELPSSTVLLEDDQRYHASPEVCMVKGLALADQKRMEELAARDKLPPETFNVDVKITCKKQKGVPS